LAVNDELEKLRKSQHIPRRKSGADQRQSAADLQGTITVEVLTHNHCHV